MGSRTPCTAVLVPIKSFALAKQRLASVASATERGELSRFMAARVISAAGDLAAFVACDDDIVEEWAVEQGAVVVRSDGLDLNAAVTLGMNHVQGRGFQQVVVAHGDLPLATSFASVASFNGITLVPDTAGSGTNVACVPVGVGFRVRYGEGSFERHLAEAARCAEASGVAYRVLRDEALALDIDTPSDLNAAARLAGDLAAMLGRHAWALT